ncbi:hypothetical protein DL765_006701 [Monosporascus sp. GIB2]|nr:hypothetical protein DL765_006701 [Monosporascus sp. GIB2]
MEDADSVREPRDELAAHLELLRDEYEGGTDVELRTAPIFTEITRHGGLRAVSRNERGDIEGATIQSIRPHYWRHQQKHA